jgi:hypothetical protein
MEDSMAKPADRTDKERKESAQEFVRRVLVDVFEQKPSQRTVANVAAKVVKALPPQVA